MAPVSVTCGRYVFVLPDAGATVRLVSRSAVPAVTRPGVAVDRRLGVLLRGLSLRSGESVLPMPLDLPGLVVGWWQPEQHGPNTLLAAGPMATRRWRWRTRTCWRRGPAGWRSTSPPRSPAVRGWSQTPRAYRHLDRRCRLTAVAEYQWPKVDLTQTW